jgi:hypothetical protein
VELWPPDPSWYGSGYGCGRSPIAPSRCDMRCCSRYRHFRRWRDLSSWVGGSGAGARGDERDCASLAVMTCAAAPTRRAAPSAECRRSDVVRVRKCGTGRDSPAVRQNCGQYPV